MVDNTVCEVEGELWMKMLCGEGWEEVMVIGKKSRPKSWKFFNYYVFLTKSQSPRLKNNESDLNFSHLFFLWLKKGRLVDFQADFFW